MATFTQQEFTAFAKKLDDWSKTLSDKERSMLELVLDRACANAGELNDELNDEQLANVSGGIIIEGAPTFSPIGKAALKIYSGLPAFGAPAPKISGIVAPDM